MYSWIVHLLFVVVSAVLEIDCQNYSPTVIIPDGKIIGIVNKTVGEKKTYYAYRGIPYAEKPVGHLRFAAPIKNAKWQDILYATNDEKICIQMSVPVNEGDESTLIGSEDCLYINVYTTNLNSSLPVMFWIYGGGFTSGSSSYQLYGPDYLIEKDIVFVSFNYRLGVFGYLSTEDLIVPGNMGMKDQVLALKWVKENIAYFGGDPNRITIAGESSGAASVGYLLQSPLTKGLYRAAIMQSGTTLSRWSLTSDARIKAFDIGRLLGITNVTSQQLIEGLRKVDANKLEIAQTNLTNKIIDTDLGGLAIGVVKEPKHPGSFFDSESYALLKNDAYNQVPAIIGYNSLEATMPSEVEEFVKSLLASTDGRIVQLLPRDLTSNPTLQLSAIESIKSFYFGLNGYGTHDEIARFLTNELFVRSIRKTVEFMAKHNNIYLYQFSHIGDLGYLNRTFKGVAHAEDLLYLFNMNFPLYPSSKIANHVDTLTRQKLVTLWTNFVKTLDPTPSGSSTILKHFKWIPNNSLTHCNLIKYLDVKESLEMKSNPWETDWQLFTKIYKEYGDSHYATY